VFSNYYDELQSDGIFDYNQENDEAEENNIAYEAVVYLSRLPGLFSRD
jgi:hypothetical protein